MMVLNDDTADDAADEAYSESSTRAVPAWTEERRLEERPRGRRGSLDALRQGAADTMTFFRRMSWDGGAPGGVLRRNSMEDLRSAAMDDDVMSPSVSDRSLRGASREAATRRPTFARQLSLGGNGFLRRMKSLTNIGPSYLDNVLGQEFVGASNSSDNSGDSLGDNDADNDCASETAADTSDRRPSVTEEGVKNEFSKHSDLQKFSARVVQQKWFTGSAMLLTFYALYVPDMDRWLGNKQSRFVISIITTAISVFFLFELVMQCLGKAQYVCRPYFWLDFVAFISLLPDTYLLEVFSSNNAFVAGRSSRLTRVLFLASRSSRAARLNRLSRVIRVVALLPRIQRFFSRGARDVVTDRLLDKKLQRIFHFLDEDMDGYVTRDSADRCLNKIRSLACPEKGRLSWAGSMARRLPRSPTFARSMTVTRTVTQTDTLRNAANAAAAASAAGAAATGSRAASPVSSTPSSQFVSSPSRKSLSEKSVSGRSDPGGMIDDSDLVNLETFRSMILEDPSLNAGLRKACRKQINESNNVKNVTARNAEAIGVKIALWVLMLLFLLSFMMNVQLDTSAEFGVASIDRFVRAIAPNASEGSRVPLAVQNQVLQFSKSDSEWRPEAREVLYLDLNRRIYCNDFVSQGSRCALYNSSALVWTSRTSMSAIDDDLRVSHYRVQDLVLIRVPNLEDFDFSDEEFDLRTTAVAVLNDRSSVQQAAMNSVLTTSSVILIILIGIFFVTKDLTFLSRNLLKPLVELADEMESASRLQLAGFSSVEDTSADHGLSEIRLIRRTFENMKKAIRSWGKYVPWQVVQALIRKDTDVNIDVQEMEVSVFFSDIANFTSIVEGLPAERSLLLLSRYFHDMSKIMDEYGGIVIEFIGDAILGIYGAPVANEEHPTAALKSALRMIDQLYSINKWLKERNLPPIAIRCGLHTGMALVGNMGFQSRMKYGIVGEEADIPSRLEEMNKTYSTKLLISQAMHDRLVPDSFVSRPIDWVVYEAISDRPQLVYEVLERNKFHRATEQRNQACMLHAKALELYRQRDFLEAANKFEEVHVMMEQLRGVDDVPSALLMKRCRSYMDNPPPSDWEGVWDRGEVL